jgi:endo-1,4-beta-xylanase
VSRWTRREILRAGAATVAVAQAPAFAAGPADDALEWLAHAKGMHFGSSLGGRGLADPGYVDLIRAQCSVIVPENELKMPVIQPVPGEFHFERGDALLQFAAANDMKVRGHCLLWHHPRWLPRWMQGYDFG